jgi:light-regulated signal transduction histidine kinase (bacteriophytochrome)
MTYLIKDSSPLDFLRKIILINSLKTVNETIIIQKICTGVYKKGKICFINKSKIRIFKDSYFNQMSKTTQPVDLTNCDKEPIHLLGKIQSQGLLFAFDKQSLNITFASKNYQNHPEFKALRDKKHISHILDEKAMAYLETLLTKEFHNHLYPYRVDINDSKYLCYFSDAQTEVILELELQDEASSESNFSMITEFNNINQNFKNCHSLDALYATIVHQIQHYTGFDRVMMYQFDKEGHGQVIAEEKIMGLESFLGLKYPASDIPKQARLLYLTNLSRAIDDVSDEGIPIDCFKEHPKPLDLSYSIYRSVSPIHIQYLKNMKVTATHALSLVLDNELWGMIILHHYNGAKSLNFQQRAALEALTTNVLSNIQLLTIKNKQKLAYEQSILLKRISNSNKKFEPHELIELNWPDISKHLKSCGYCLTSQNQKIFTQGLTPDLNDFEKLHKAIIKANKQLPIKEKVFYSNDIQSRIKNWENISITGFMQLAIVPELNKYLYVWRESEEQSTNWAGNPDKAVTTKTVGGEQQLLPRTSFELWKETTKHKSLPWLTEEIEFSKHLVEVFMSREIEIIDGLLKSNEALLYNEEILKSLIESKSEDLYKLNIKLQKELESSKLYQRELELSKKAAEGLSQLKSNIVSNLSHEIRTPINGIIGLCNVIKQDSSYHEDIKSLGHMIFDSAERLLNTVNKILKVGRLEQFKKEVVFERVNLVPLTEEALKPLKVLAEKKSLQVVFNKHNENLKVVTDPFYYQDILVNLVDNAIKFTDHGGYIEINLKQVSDNDQDLVLLSVEDNGPGVSKAELKRIFDPFYTSEKTTHQADNSAGLGLHLVKNYANFINGDLSVTSEVGKGSIFTLTIKHLN